MVPINTRRDFGIGIEIDEGPRGGDSLIVSPPASLGDGAQVKVEPDNAPGQQGGTPAGGDAKKAGPPASATPGGGDGGPGAPGGPEKEKVSER